MFCTSCGNEQKGDEKFCTKCGMRLKLEENGISQTQENTSTDNPDALSAKKTPSARLIKKKEQKENNKFAWYDIVILYAGLPIMVGAFFDVPIIPTYLVIDGILLAISIFINVPGRKQKENAENVSSAETADLEESVTVGVKDENQNFYFQEKRGNKEHDKRGSIIAAIVFLLLTLGIFWAAFH